MNQIRCDICHITTDIQSDSWTKINGGFNINGAQFRDICPDCALWMINKFIERKKESGIEK